MEFQVMNREEARRYSYKKHEETSIIISISDACSCPNRFQKNTQNGIKNVLQVFFDDVEKGEKDAICDDDAIKIAKFVKNNEEYVDKIIVHCNAGVSRSAGVCAAIMKYMTGDDMDIFGRACYCPNMTCYTKVLSALMGTEYVNTHKEEIKKEFEINTTVWTDGYNANENK